MPINPEVAVQNLMYRDPSIIAAAVVEGSSNIVYSTKNWDISADLERVVSSWTGQNAQSVMICGVKYSILQCTNERLFATSIRGEGHIIGAKDEERKLIVYLEPNGEPLGATMDVQRTLGEMNSRAKYMEKNIQSENNITQMGKIALEAKEIGGARVDPQLKSEVQAFLDWIKDADGLAGYMKYYFQQNNAQIISALSKIYIELRQIFGV